MQINQFLPNFDYGDAISNHAIEIKKTLASAGYDSKIYVNHCSEQMKKGCRHFSEYKENKGNIAIFHFSIKSILDDFVFDLKEKLVIIYHNTTPAEYFYNVNDEMARLLENTDEILLKLKKRTSLAIGVSEFNSEHLKKMGFKNVATIPLIINLEKYQGAINNSLYDKYKDGFTNILFVGRLTPNKKHEDLLKTFYIYNKYINQRSRLFIVGSFKGSQIYCQELIRIQKELNLNNVFITGLVPFEELATYYKLADVFLSMSEHEGFLAPLPECMKMEVPILAFNSSAVPHTLEGAGIVFNKKNYGAVAELIDFAVKNKKTIIEEQNKRLTSFDQEKIKKDFLNELKQL